MTDRRALSQRFERSAAGRTVILFVVVVLLSLEVGVHLPAGSALNERYGPMANEYIRYVGAEQAWGVFAPNPRGTSLQVEARVTFADGRTAVWELPHGSNLGGNLRFYRWRKWLERVRSDDHRSLWEPTARWVASLYGEEGSPVVQVELVRSFRRNVVAGSQPPYEEFTYFTYAVPEAAS